MITSGAGYIRKMLFPFALAGGATIFGIVILIFVLVLAYTAYGKGGQSDIGAHSTTSQSAPGADREAGLQDPDGDDAEQVFDDHGVK